VPTPLGGRATFLADTRLCVLLAFGGNDMGALLDTLMVVERLPALLRVTSSVCNCGGGGGRIVDDDRWLRAET
jgi:hypothetical protein